MTDTLEKTDILAWMESEFAKTCQVKMVDGTECGATAAHIVLVACTIGHPGEERYMCTFHLLYLKENPHFLTCMAGGRGVHRAVISRSMPL